MPSNDIVLQLKFAAASGKERTINVSDPKSDLTSQQVDAAMDTILENQVFTTSAGELLTRSVSAKYVETTRTEYAVQYPNS